MDGKIIVPDFIIPKLHLLFNLSQEQRDYLHSALEEAIPCFNDDEFTAQVVSSKLGVSNQEKDEIIQALLSLSLGKYIVDRSLPDFVAGTVDYLLTDEVEEELFDRTLREKYVGELTRYLCIEHSVAAKAKSIYILMQNERLFTDAHVMTDIRPVFGDKVGEVPLGGLILHNLCIEHKDGSSEKCFHLTLDTSDLGILIKALQRAQMKATSLSSLMATMKLPILSDEE